MCAGVCRGRYAIQQGIVWQTVTVPALTLDMSKTQCQHAEVYCLGKSEAIRGGPSQATKEVMNLLFDFMVKVGPASQLVAY